MPNELRYIRSFTAFDEDGNEFTLEVYREIIDVGTNTDAELEGLLNLFTDDGLDVNVLGKGKYQIVETGQVLNSDDPDAP